MGAALTFAPAQAVLAALPTCDTPLSTCEILSDRTYSDPNTYNYDAIPKDGVTVTAVGATPSVTITQTGGTVIAKSYTLENNAYYNMSGGTANVSGDFAVSLYNLGVVTATVSQTGGTMNVGGALKLAYYGGNTGIYTLSGGQLNAGSLVLVPGSVTNATAYVYLNGGTLTTSQITRVATGMQSHARLWFNGTTVRAGSTDNANWLNIDNGFDFQNHTTDVAVRGGGAIFDTNGRSMGISTNLPGPYASDGSGGLTKRGAGTLTLSAGNSFTGNTTVEAGTLILANVNAVVNSTAILNGGPLSFSGITNATLGGLAGSQNFTLQNTGSAAVALAVGNNGASTTYSGAMSGSGSLIKFGGGTLTLGGANTYSGTTSVNSGTLRVNGSVGGALAVAINATLGGSGSINGTAQIQSGGHLAPGNSPGTLTFANGLVLSGGAILDLELGTTSDLVRVSGGTFSAAGVATINVADSGGFGYGNYTLIDFTGATAGGISASNFALGTKPAGNYLYALSVQGSKLMLGVTAPPPTVTSVSGPAAGLYGIGKPLDFTVHFDKAVTVTGVPRLVLTLPGFGAQYANYVSGSGTADPVFRYTVTGGIPNSMSGITLAGSIDLNGGGLVDAIGTAAVSALNNAPSLAGITLDGTVPTPISILLVGSPPASSVTVSYTVVFSESVTGVAAGAFNVGTGDGTATGQVGAISGSGDTYTVAVTRIGGFGHLFLALKNSGTGITDLAGNAISGGFQGNQFFANVQRRCYVNKTAAGANDGTSWTDAYTDLQSAVRDVGCVEIWTAKGIYKPGSATSDSFRPRAGLKMYGGFAGVEALLAERTPSVIAVNPTVLSGDIDNNDTTDADGVVLDAAQIAGGNSANVILMNNAGAAGYGADTVIDGFIITAGDAGSGGAGGGLRCDASLSQPACNFTLNNLVFSGNRGGGGGALSMSSSAGTANAVVSKTLFRGNRAIGGGASGGAIFLGAPTAAGRTSPAFSNVVFSGNTSLNWGGAIDLNVNLGTVTPTFDNATFAGNVSSALRGGAIASQAFGGGTARPTLRNTILWDGTDPEIVLDGSGAAVLEYSIAQGGCPGGTTCTNLVAGDPKLGALGNYGGAVPTLPLGGGSAALDSGACALSDDMRGVARPQGAGCDVGAFESRLSVLTVTISGGGSVSAGAAPLPMSGGIANCSNACTATYDGEAPPTVTLTATPNAQQSFSTWSGDCSGSNPVATVAMTAAKNCTATFVPNVVSTTLVLSAGSNPSVYDTTLSFTATVTAMAPAAQTPTGSVLFYDGGMLLATRPLASGAATFTTGSMNAGSHTLTALYGGDANYASAAQTPSAPLTQVVTPAPTTLTWAAPAAIAYGTPLSSTQLNATAADSAGPVAGTFIYTPPAGSVLAAGGGQTLSVTFTPIDTTNYLGATASVPIDVTRAPLNVTGTSVQNKTYDGNATAALSSGTLVGVLAADSGNVTLTQSGTFAQSNVGNAIAVTANDSIAGSAAVNYTLTQPVGLSANITPATLTYKAAPATSSYGTTPNGLTGTVTGFVTGEAQVTATGGTLDFTTTATAASAPGSYAIDGAGLSANHGNYVFAQDAANATALTITASSTTTTLSAPATAVYGQSVTFTATVSLPAGNSGTAAGTVTFTESGNPLPGGCAAAATVVAGSASCTTSALAASTHQIVATFVPSDSNTGGSSGTAGVSVGAAATTTAIINTQPWTLTLGASTPVNVTVAANAPGSGTPTGSVTVSDGTKQCTIAALSNGAGSCTLTPGSAGGKTVTATYVPDAAASANFGGSSATASLVVDPAQPGADLSNSVNPSVFGQNVVFTATVTPVAGGVIPTGSVTFSDGGTPLCTAVALVAGTGNATAACATSALSVAGHTVTARYSGDANNQSSTTTLNQAVNKADQTLAFPAQTTPNRVFAANATFAIAPLATSAEPNSGQPIVYTSATAAVCSVGATTVTMLGAGTCTIAANQAGDGNYNAAAEVRQSIAIGSAASTIALAASTTTPTVDDLVTLTATVTGQAPTGTVTIKDGGTVLCDRITLVTNGNTATATCGTNFATAGSRNLAAAYSGDADNAAQNAAPLTIDVGLKCAAMSLTATPASISVGQNLTVTATVSACSVPTQGGGTAPSGKMSNIEADAAAAAAPTGTVAYYDGSAALGQAALGADGIATLSLSTLGAGTHTLHALYSGDRAFMPAQAQTDVVVAPPAAVPVPAPALQAWALGLLAAILGLAGAMPGSRRKRGGSRLRRDL